jgi:hypothetical protein
MFNVLLSCYFSPAGEKLDLLVDKTDLLQGEAFAFRREATRARRVMWWKVRSTGVCGLVKCLCSRGV